MMLVSGSDLALAAIVMGTTTMTVITVVRMSFRYLERKQRLAHAPPPMNDDRLLRLEQAVDAIAIEVERMSESQRFVTKILAERLPSGQPSSSLSRGS